MKGFQAKVILLVLLAPGFVHAQSVVENAFLSKRITAPVIRPVDIAGAATACSTNFLASEFELAAGKELGISIPALPIVGPVCARGRWSCKSSCNVQPIGGTKTCPERVFGEGIGSSEQNACSAARVNATQSTPRGCYPRHCDCFPCVKK